MATPPTYCFRDIFRHKDRSRLTKLKQLIKQTDAIDVLYKHRNDDDMTVFEALKKVIKPQDDAAFNVHKIKYLNTVPSLTPGDTRVLDFGGANGLIADAIAREYKINIVDVVDVHSVDFAVKSDRIRYSQMAKEIYKMPYDDNTFYLITSFMVLHHIEPEHLKYIVHELHRVCQKYLLIQEHDGNESNKCLLDILHGLYIFVYKDNDYGKLTHFSEYKAWYKSAAEFDKMFEGKFVLVKRFPTNKITNNFVALYEKI